MQELCQNGGILFVAQAILKLNATAHFRESPKVVASVSRLKAKLLSIVSLVVVFNISWRMTFL